MPSTQQTDAPSKQSVVIKIAVAVLALTGAGYFVFLRADPDKQQLDTPESAAPYMCRACSHELSLTPARFEELLNSGGMNGEDGERRGRLALRCPKCQKFALLHAVRCPKDKQIYLPRGNDGKPAKCPKCGSKPPQG